MILVDTNIWGRIASNGDKLHKAAMRALQWSIRHDQPAIAAQSIYEFWVVATRPSDKNGLGWTAARAASWIEPCRRSCRFLPEDPRILDAWVDLVKTYDTKGKPAHDARLVAYMKHYGIPSILTFNISDFARYGLNVIDPRNIATS